MKQRHTWILLACLVAVMVWVLRKPAAATGAEAKTGKAIHGSSRHEASVGETVRKSPHRPEDSEAERKNEIGKFPH